jgi:acetyl-CoA carboxylase biotin carboxyl carrier protein
MDLKEIKRLIEIVETAKISHFNIEYENMKIEIKKEFGHSGPMPVSITTHAPLASAIAESVAVDAPVEFPKKDDKLIPIKSQMVGTFYTSASPESPEYVKVGDRVEIGKVICIIEAMKLFNEIESDISGVIEKVCVPNATPVEYGQDLFLIRIG